MILNPTPFLGFNGVFKGPVNHVAMAQRLLGVTPISTDIGFRVSSSGKQFHPRGIDGDLASATQGGGGSGAFYPSEIRKIGSALYAVGRLWDDGNNARCAIYRSADGGRTWWHKPTSIDGTKGSSGDREFVGIAGNNDYIVALSSSGERAVSTDGGETFTGYGNIGFSGTKPARCIAASAAGFVAGGLSGQLFTVADPRSAWGARTSQFGSGRIDVAVAGNVFLMAGINGLVSTAPLNDLSTFTARTTGISGNFNGAAHRSGRWFLWGPQSLWVTTPDGLGSFTVPASNPGGIVTDCYHDGEKWLAFRHGGGLAFSENDTTWETVDSPGLIAAPYVACAA